LVASGLPSNFLEGNNSPGDSGGGLFVTDPLDNTWRLTGVTSWAQADPNSPPGSDWNFRYNQFPATGGAKGAFTRISSYASWIQANSYGPATPYPAPPSPPANPSLLVTGTGTPVSISIPVIVDCQTSTLSIDYAFPDGAGAVDIYFAGVLQAGFLASGTGLSTFAIPLITTAKGCGATGSNRIALTSLLQVIEFRVTTQPGARFLMKNVSFPGLANGDFAEGLSGWLSSVPTAITVVDSTQFLPPSNVNVPNVVGQSQSAATMTITGAGLVVGTVTQQSSNTVPSGNVISQSPTAGTSVAAGSAVNLVVSSGPAPVLPGDVNGDSLIDCTDVGIVKAAMGTRRGQSRYDPRADIDNNGRVNGRDLSFVIQEALNFARAHGNPVNLSCR
jgi:hypothetical protein